jgi:hypothetical protein
LAIGCDLNDSRRRVRGCETLLPMRRPPGLGAIALAAIVLVACGDDIPAGTGPVADAAPGPDAEPPPADAGPPVAIEYLDPDHGPFAGGTDVLLRGRGFKDGMIVTIGGRQVDPIDLQVVDTRRALLKTPPGSPGTASVTVSAPDGDASADGAFRYEAMYCDPASGSIAGGTFVRVRGLGTSFHDGDQVSFDGAALTGVVVVNEQEIDGFTPAGVSGAADVKVVGAAGTIEAHDAYVYELTADPNAGGLSGGPIASTLNVTVADRLTRNGIPDAFVTVGDPAVSSFKGHTNDFGQLTFGQAGLAGPVTVTASKPGYERGAFVDFDANEVTIFLMPLPPPVPPDPGPTPPGRRSGTISGVITFGTATGLGSPTWDLVPEPRSPHEQKRALVFTTVSTPFSGTPYVSSGGIIDYENDGRIGWGFDIPARPAAQAVIAVAGLWNDSIDPDGDGPAPVGTFYPFAMGVARGVLVGAGEDVENVSINIDLPLDAALRVQLADPPPLAEPGVPDGPDQYLARAFIDLGGEGVIVLPSFEKHFAPGRTDTIMTALPQLQGVIGDASYTLVTGAFTGNGGAPDSVRIERGLDADALAHTIVVGDFLGVPRAVDPAAGQLGSGGHLVWAPEGHTTGQPTFSYHTLQSAGDGKPLWRLFARGGLRDLPLYDLVTWGGMDPLPSPADLVWVVYELRIPGVSFDEVNYRHINVNLWSAYSNDGYVVSLPP